jgi:hypothetical protein
MHDSKKLIKDKKHLLELLDSKNMQKKVLALLKTDLETLEPSKSF